MDRTCVTKLLNMVLVVSLLVGIGCASSDSTFKKAEGVSSVKPGSVAVISGSSSEVDIRLSEEVTRLLFEKSKFKVLNQDEITKSIPEYPMYFMESQPTDVEKGTINQSYLTEKNQSTINKMQEKLKVQYVILVWTTGITALVSASGSNVINDVYWIYVPVRVVSYPDKKVVAFTNAKIRGSYIRFRSLNNATHKLLTEAAEEIVDSFLEMTEGGKI